MHNEMQTIQQLPQHENIVRFLEINDHEVLHALSPCAAFRLCEMMYSCLPLVLMQKQTRCAIIVMELCNAGSLYEVIDSPENAFGLDEVQFKTVIHDVG